MVFVAEGPEVRWEEPPPASEYPRCKQGGGCWQRFTAELQERPGEWAVACKDESEKYAYQSVKKSLKRYGCEVRVRQVDKRVSVWARWPEENA